MAKLARSSKVEDKADIVYSIPTPFQISDSKILVLKKDSGKVEIIIGKIPVPSGYYTDRNYPDLLENEDSMRRHSVAKWIISETTQILSEYDFETSNHISNNPNHSLSDIYFTCEIEKVDDAVIDAKRFLTELEQKTVRHEREFGNLSQCPSEELPTN
jgi:hypothetical protein